MSTTGGFDEIGRNLARYTDELKRRSELAAGELAALLEAYCKQTTAFKDVTGNLRNSIHGTWEESSPGVFRIVLSAGMEYAIFVELGHGTRGGGQVAGRPYLWPTIVENQGRAVRMWAERLA